MMGIHTVCQLVSSDFVLFSNRVVRVLCCVIRIKTVQPDGAGSSFRFRSSFTVALVPRVTRWDDEAESAREAARFMGPRSRHFK